MRQAQAGGYDGGDYPDYPQQQQQTATVITQAPEAPMISVSYLWATGVVVPIVLAVIGLLKVRRDRKRQQS